MPRSAGKLRSSLYHVVMAADCFVGELAQEGHCQRLTVTPGWDFETPPLKFTIILMHLQSHMS